MSGRTELWDRPEAEGTSHLPILVSTRVIYEIGISLRFFVFDSVGQRMRLSQPFNPSLHPRPSLVPVTMKTVQPMSHSRNPGPSGVSAQMSMFDSGADAVLHVHLAVGISDWMRLDG